MSKPIAVLAADIHYSLPNLKLADAALRQAVLKANTLGVQLWICGDLHDTKANLRGECLNTLIKTLMLADKKPRILIGNHDRINEKSEEHSLTVLDGFYAEIIGKPVRTHNGIHFIPYNHDPEDLRSYLRAITPHSTIIMHQGISGSNMGDYVVDKSSIKPEDVSGHRVLSGHYHARQTIQLSSGGVWDYIGNPFTVSYGEANDPDKGFQILMDDGGLEFVPTNLRRHIVIETDDNFTKPENCIIPKQGDLVWVRIHDKAELLQTITRGQVAAWLGIKEFRLDLIPDEAVSNIKPSNLSKPELLDSIIDSLSNTSDEQKSRVKDLWKTMV